MGKQTALLVVSKPEHFGTSVMKVSKYMGYTFVELPLSLIGL